MRRFEALLTLLFLCISLPRTVSASDFSMKCDEKKCTPASIARFFDENIQWYPGQSLSNTVTIENKSKDAQYVGHRAFNVQSSAGADLARALDLVIIRKSVNKQVWSSTLGEFYTTSEAVLGVLGPGKTDSFEYTISMNRNAGNEYQGKKTGFDLMFGYFMPTVTPTPTNTPMPTNTPIPTPTIISPTEEQSATESGTVQGVFDVKRPSILDKLRHTVSQVVDSVLPYNNARRVLGLSDFSMQAMRIPNKKPQQVLHKKITISPLIWFILILIISIGVFVCILLITVLKRRKKE